MNGDTRAVVVNWNGGDQNLTCIESLLAAGLAQSDVIVVDNGSGDGSPEAIAARFPDVILLRNPDNRGYGHGTNRGVSHALESGAEFVFLVNNDVVLEPSCLQQMRARLDVEPSVGVVGPRVLLAREPSTIWAAGGTLTFRQNLSTLRGHHKPDGPEYRQTLRVDYVAGCAMLVRRAVFERAGLLEADYFAYHEDLEFCLAASEAGFGVECVGAAAALHDAHGSTGGGYNPRRKYMMGVNTIWFLRRRGTPLRWASFALFDVAPLPVLYVVGLFTGRARGVAAKALGTWHGLRGRRVVGATLEPGGTALW